MSLESSSVDSTAILEDEDDPTTSKTTTEDDRLVQLYLEEANLQALEQLLRRHEPAIAKICLGITNHREDAADCAQDTIVKIVRCLGSYRRSGSFSTWVRTVTRSVCYSNLRRQKRTLPSPLEATSSSSRTSRSADEILQQRERNRAVKNLISQALTHREREIFRLHHVDGFSLSHLTHSLGLKNTSGARAYLARATRKLRKAVESGRWRRELHLFAPSPPLTTKAPSRPSLPANHNANDHTVSPYTFVDETSSTRNHTLLEPADLEETRKSS